MITKELNAEEVILQFIKDYAHDELKTELLVFFGYHPNSLFSRMAICCSRDWEKIDVCKALGEMVEQGLLDSYVDNRVILYSLTTNQEKRQQIIKLSSMSWNKRQLMLRKVL